MSGDRGEFTGDPVGHDPVVAGAWAVGGEGKKDAGSCGWGGGAVGCGVFGALAVVVFLGANVKIRFERTIDFVIAFSRSHHDGSQYVRRSKWVLTLLLPGIMALLFGLYILGLYRSREEDEPFNWVAAICLAVVYLPIAIGVLGFRRFMAWSTAWTIRKLLAEGSNRTLLGWRDMELVNGRLIVTSELVSTSLDLRAIVKIVNDDDYTYVYYSSIEAFMIPMNLYPEVEYREFVAKLREAWENRGSRMVMAGNPPAARAVDDRITGGQPPWRGK